MSSFETRFCTHRLDPPTALYLLQLHSLLRLVFDHCSDHRSGLTVADIARQESGIVSSRGVELSAKDHFQHLDFAFDCSLVGKTVLMSSVKSKVEEPGIPKEAP